MSDQTLLSGLCCICNTETSKYRCPGCSARTCSLPCYKRHQQWAQCSGQRDPAKFVKKSQLVTPAGIDHDFNFLTRIERDIDKAEVGLKATSETEPTSQRSWSQSHEKQVKYQQLENAGVRVIRAPKGLSRQKENKSHRSSTKKSPGGKNIVWTVEWLDDQKRRVLTETSSACQIASAQPFAPREKLKVKKRKRNADAPSAIHPPTTQNAHTPKDQKSVQLDIVPHVKFISESRERPTAGQQSESNSNAQESEEVKAHLAEAHSPDHHDDGPSTEPVGHGDHRLYLLKPRTSSAQHVLIPLAATATLGACLHGRTVLEFPTIYVFPSSMQPLPAEFLLEEDYLKQEGQEKKEFNDLIKDLDPEILKRLRDDEHHVHNESTRGQEVDSRDILNVLKKDFGSEL